MAEPPKKVGVYDRDRDAPPGRRSVLGLDPCRRRGPRSVGVVVLGLHSLGHRDDPARRTDRRAGYRSDAAPDARATRTLATKAQSTSQPRCRSIRSGSSIRKR